MVLALTSSGLLIGSSSTQLNLLGRSVPTSSLWKAAAAGTALSGVVGYLSGLGWSLGMGHGAITSSPQVQKANAEAYYQEKSDQDTKAAWRDAQTKREIDAYWQEYDRQKYLEQQLYNSRVRDAAAQSANTPTTAAAGRFELIL